MYIYVFSQKLREKKAYDINKMSKTFEMTISRLRFSKLSLSDHSYFRPTRALIYDYEPYILKSCTYFAIISADASCADSGIPLPIRYFCTDSVIL